MNEEQDLKLTDLDYLVGNHHLQMMKAALPYMKVPEQKTLSVFVKFNELQRTISLFHDEEVSTLGICSMESKRSPLDMLRAIKPFGNSSEQDMIDLISNFMQGNRGHNIFQDLMGGGASTDSNPSANSKQEHADSTDGFGSFGKKNSLEQLKGFLSPEKQSQLETMQILMQTMQQMT